jgi:GGDEF domain-containing protein
MVVSTVSLFLAMVKDRTNKLLEPLISRDINTGAQLGKFLRPALSIEITRAEREGTGLLLMHIQTAQNKKNTNKEELEEKATEYAKAINKHLRLFDQCYRIDEQNFSIILPHATSQEAEVTARKIIGDVHTSHSEETAFGFASLNVGDTSDSLIRLSQQELIHVTN